MTRESTLQKRHNFMIRDIKALSAALATTRMILLHSALI